MSEKQLVETVLKGHAPAMHFFNTLARVSQVMDDLVDRDKPVGDDVLKAFFWDVLVTLPVSVFYREHMDRLMPIISQVLTDWFVANDLEKSGDVAGLQVAFVIRDNLAQVLCQCAGIVGGSAWMLDQAKAIRLFVHDESFDEYMRDLHG